MLFPPHWGWKLNLTAPHNNFHALDSHHLSELVRFCVSHSDHLLSALTRTHSCIFLPQKCCIPLSSSLRHPQGSFLYLCEVFPWLFCFNMYTSFWHFLVTVPACEIQPLSPSDILFIVELLWEKYKVYESGVFVCLLCSLSMFQVLEKCLIWYVISVSIFWMCVNGYNTSELRLLNWGGKRNQEGHSEQTQSKSHKPLVGSV